MSLLDRELKKVVRSSPVEVLAPNYYVAQGGEFPESFASIQDGVERTLIVEGRFVPEGYDKRSVRGPFKAVRLRISVPFEAPGFIAYACSLLAKNKHSVLALSTFSFDYLLVKQHEIDDVVRVLKKGGFPILPATE